METTHNEQQPHSAEYFGESRDFWWNTDFLELMSTRLQLRDARRVLDVGCGIGHWGQLLSSVLSPDAQLIGVDREPTWVAQATERAAARGLSDRFSYQLGDATQLPFEDASFDLVTCQTVLIHLKDPKAGLREMLRVLKPGGLLLAAEPNNLANRAVASSLTEQLTVDEVMERLRFGLIVERGKQALGLGFNSVGDLVPGYLAELGAANIRVYLSDKASPCFAPYSTREQRVNIQQQRDWAKRGFAGWDRDELRGYFLAGGGAPAEFDRAYELQLRDTAAMLEAIDRGTYHSAGGALQYLIAAQRA